MLCVVGVAFQLGGVLNPLAALDGALANILGIVLAGAGMVGLELHVRFIEEPYLLRVHGEQYAAYAAQVGRFLPGIGRLRRIQPGA